VKLPRHSASSSQTTGCVSSIDEMATRSLDWLIATACPKRDPTSAPTMSSPICAQVPYPKGNDSSPTAYTRTTPGGV